MQANVSDLLYETGSRERHESGIGVSVVSIRRHDKIVPKTTLNAQNLEALGAARLAELLIELSQGYATAKRRLRMELAGTRGTDALAKEVRNRITTMARSRSFVDWQGKKPAEKDRVKIAWSSSGPIYADEMAESSRVSTVRLALMNIADGFSGLARSAVLLQQQARLVRMPPRSPPRRHPDRGMLMS